MEPRSMPLKHLSFNAVKALNKHDHLPFPPKLRSLGLIKYGVVNVVNQAKKIPIAIENPKSEASKPSTRHLPRDKGPILAPYAPW